MTIVTVEVKVLFHFIKYIFHFTKYIFFYVLILDGTIN